MTFAPFRDSPAAASGHGPCNSSHGTQTGVAVQGWQLFVFALAAGFTASGLAASLYRLACVQLRIRPESQAGKISRWMVMVVAGPNVLLSTAIKNMRARQWKPAQFWVITALVSYWSLALGLFVIDVAVHI